MSKFYVEGDHVKFNRCDLWQVDMETYTGEKFKKLEPRRLFPMTGITKYITLIDEEGNEKAIIRDVETLLPESRKVIEACLGEYYMIPKITAIYQVVDKFGILRFDVKTDRGDTAITIKNRHHDIKVLYGERVLMRDKDDNRYEITDYKKLDKRSVRILYLYI